MKFRVGETVVCIDNDNSYPKGFLKVGAKYTIVDISTDSQKKFITVANDEGKSSEEAYINLRFQSITNSMNFIEEI